MTMLACMLQRKYTPTTCTNEHVHDEHGVCAAYLVHRAFDEMLMAVNYTT